MVPRGFKVYYKSECNNFSFSYKMDKASDSPESTTPQPNLFYVTDRETEYLHLKPM